MKNLFLAFLISFLLCSCENDSFNKRKLNNYIPENTSVVIEINNLESFSNSLNNNTLINNIYIYKDITRLDSLLKPLQYLKSNFEILVCLSKSIDSTLNYTIVTKYTDNLFNLDSISNHSIETLKNYNPPILKTSIDNTTLYTIIKDSIFIASNNLANIESVIQAKKNNTSFNALLKTTNSNTTASVVLDTKEMNTVFFNSDSLNTIQFTNYVTLDFEITKNEILYNGITTAKDSSKSLINSFKNTIPQENKIASISPANIESLLSFTFHDYKIFSNNISQFNKKPIDSSSTIFDNSVEIGLIKKANQQAILLRLIDAEITEESFEASNHIESFREITIKSFSNPELFSHSFSPLITFSKASNYFRLNDFLIFSDDIEFLKTIISNYLNNNTLNKSDAYLNIKQHLSDESSLLYIGNASQLNSVLNTNFKEQKNLKLKDYKFSAIQFIYETDFAHINGVIKKHKGRIAFNSISESFSTSIDNDIIGTPQIVKNHLTKQKEIIVQDVNNNLHLISNKGNILWTKKLNGKILGDVNQIDIYKNGRLQLAFATPKRVYILDRNGKDVDNFPLKFNDDITQPLSVFDYDKKKDYRLLVTQNNALLMYDKNGKSVKGFTFKKATNTISSQPKHFRIGRKDFIVFKEGKKLQILDRIGKTRINIKEDFTFSDNAIFLYRDQFTTTTQKGDLIQINGKGQLSSVNLNLNENHKITTTSKTFVSLSENILKIKSKTVALDFGDYTAPKIFYLNDKIYVTTTDLQSKKAYLFDSQAKPIANFPVFGNSSIVLENIDKDRNLEVVVKGENNSIIVYQIN